jgi:hypothetical protein
LAQYHGVLEAARRFHDEHLNVGSYHLFRMPEEIEQDLHSLIRSPQGEAIVGKLPNLKDEALEAIKHFLPHDLKISEGPNAIGSIKDIDSSDALKAIAGTYGSAFSCGVRAYPYLVG